VKLVDTHTHLPGTLFGASPRPVEDIHRQFAAEGITQAWFFTTDGLIRDAARNNDILAEAVRGHTDMFVPFCTVDPHTGADAAIRELERCVGSLAMRGLKLHPWLQAFSLTNPAVVPVLQRAGELGVPALFHDGSPPYSTPLQIAWAAEQSPGTQIVLGHSGLDDLTDEAIRAADRHANVWLSLCGPSCGAIEEIVRRAPPEKLLFGTDGGGFVENLTAWYVAKIRACAPSDTLREMIFHQNAERLLEVARQGARRK
jgi:uncharacterized protein